MYRIFLGLSVLLFLACTTPGEKKAITLYNAYCATCHKAPGISELPKKLWAEEILPEMGARLGIRDNGYDPFKGLSFSEMNAVLKTGVFPGKALIAKDDWETIKQYIIAHAPDSLRQPQRKHPAMGIPGFTEKPISLDSNGRSSITFLKCEPANGNIVAGEVSGRLFHLDPAGGNNRSMGGFRSSIVDYTESKAVKYVTTIGSIRPTELANGSVFHGAGGKTTAIGEKFHRPVNTLVYDLDGDGVDELVVSEFGDLAGSLTLLHKTGSAEYEKTVLLQQPGCIRSLARDMNHDGKTDIVVLTAQGDEGVTILFQEEDLEFTAKKVIRFSPVYGTSWFELVDYDADGDQDIVSVQGDNADKSNIKKPYHGMRIHLNAGDNDFEQGFFYPFHGATRVVARDFDKDGDMDFMILSTFPDYENNAHTVEYLRNEDAATFDFTPFTLTLPEQGRWFLMDAGDIDLDGDEDIILSAFSQAYSPVPADLAKAWKDRDFDILVLENNLNPPSE